MHLEWRRIEQMAIVAGALVLAVTLARDMGAYAGGPDMSGYLNQARLLRAGAVHVPQRAVPHFPREGLSNYLFIPLGFVPRPNDMMAPTYPIGLPILVAATSWATGWDWGPPLVMWLHGLAGVTLVYALGRVLGLPASWAILSALLVATSPVYWFSALTLMSDVPAMVWTALTVLCAWRSRTRPAWAPAAGFALSIAVLVRPTDALIILPAAIALGVDGRRWLAFIAGGLPGALFFAAYNHATYGSAFVTGYGSIGPGFSTAWVPATLVHYAKWLPVALTPAVMLAFGIPWAERNRAGAVLATWIFVFAGFYLTYSFTHETWWYLRFLLPAFPALAIAALLVAKKLCTSTRLACPSRHAPVMRAICVALILEWALPWQTRLGARFSGADQHSYPEGAAWANAHLPANTILIAMETTGALYYYTGFEFIRWDQLQSREAARLDDLTTREGRPVVAMLFEFEKDEVLRRRLPGRWEKLKSFRDLTFWRRLGPLPNPP